MTMTRREWLSAAGATLAATMLRHVTACSSDDGGLPEYRYGGTPGPATMFELGVASGDALTSAVVLWTHVSPASGPVDVWVEVATDTQFARRLVARSMIVTEATDYTLRVDVDGLEAGTTYYYRFFALGIRSPVGRTRTVPAGAVESLRFAVVSCANYGYGYFHSYRRVAERHDVDAVLFLGDYLYEYPVGIFPFASEAVRTPEPPDKLVELDQYRTRYRTYHADPDLQEVHRQHVWYAIWDDHEFCDNASPEGASSTAHNPLTDGDFATRMMQARQAYFEYVPVRGTTSDVIHRAVRFGDLVDLLLLDTRMEGRSKQITDPSMDTPERSILGAAQEAWVDRTLGASTTRWRVIAQQVPMAQRTVDATTHEPWSNDTWDGYPMARTRFFDSLEAHGGDSVVLSGDMHAACVFELTRDPWDTSAYDPATGRGALSVEFVSTSVTSPHTALDPDPTDGPRLLAACPHAFFADLESKGFSIVTITPTQVQHDFFEVADIRTVDGGAATFEKSYVVTAGTRHAVETSEPAPSGTARTPAP